MGLDIFIETSAKNENERKTCHAISREFCFQICELDESDHESKSELIQVYELYNLDFTILSKMNVWRLEKELRYGAGNDLSKNTIDTKYESALQPSVELLKNLRSLYRKIEENPALLGRVKRRNSLRTNYLEQFNENIGDYVVDRNFGWDLRTMIDFLEKLPNHSMIRFGFV